MKTIISRTWNIIVIGLFLWGIIMGVERMSFFNGHPLTTLKEITLDLNDTTSVEKFSDECKVERHEVMVVVKSNNQTFVRCGEFWPFVDNYKITND